jgi:hypothetical protein
MSKWRRRYMASRAQAEQHRRECRHVAVHENAHIVIGKSFGASVSRGKICCEVMFESASVFERARSFSAEVSWAWSWAFLALAWSSAAWNRRGSILANTSPFLTCRPSVHSTSCNLPSTWLPKASWIHRRFVGLGIHPKPPRLENPKNLDGAPAS